MLASLTERLTAHPKRTLLLVGLFVVLAGVLGGPVAGLLKSGNAFRNPDSGSADATHRIERATGAQEAPGVVALAPAAAAPALARALRAEPGVAHVTTGGPALTSRDGDQAAVAFLQSMGVGGAIVAVAAAAMSLLVAPAVFVVWGAKLQVRARAGDDAREERGAWYRLSRGVMRRPGLVAAVTAAVLVAVALPAFRAHWSGVDASVLPAGANARVVAETMARDFPRAPGSSMALAISAPRADAAAVGAYAARLRDVTGVTAVAAPRPLDAGTWQVDVATSGPALGETAQRAMREIRAVDAPFPVAAGGAAARFHDQQAGIAGSLPAAVLILALSTVLILWLMTGSVLLPLQSLLMNALTVGAATGVLTLIFQDGHLEGLLGFTSADGIESADFVVTAALVFALSTDYGVFLLARIKEARERGLPDREAIALGLQRTGGIVTAAAILLAVAIGAFVTSEIVFLKQIGLGVAVGVLVDAFVVRGLLVPSLLALGGRWTWWSPAPLRRLHARIGISEAPSRASKRSPQPIPAEA